MYYLNSRYYDPHIGRFISIDAIEYLDFEIVNGLNLYAYCGNNPVMYCDPEGNAWWHWLIAGAIVAALAIRTIITAGGLVPAFGAVVSAMYGVASSVALSVFSFGFVGASIALGGAALYALSNSNSVSDFMEEGNWGTVLSVAGSGVYGMIGGYFSWNEQMRKDHSFDTERKRFWKSEANNPKSIYNDKERMSKGLAPDGYVLHHPYGRYGSKESIYVPITVEEHKAIHKMYGYGNGSGGYNQYYPFSDWWWIFRRL